MNHPTATQPTPLRPIPRATYRLQLHHDFGFREATRALPYLATLGISHVYCSPYLRATPGSMHGYDVVDPCSINPDLGTPEDFDRFNRRLQALGLTQLLDIVPNHMGIESDENAWWQDVLAKGAASPFAAFFDIDWSGTNGVAPHRLLLPILGAPLQQVIAERQLKLGRDHANRRFRLGYFQRTLPVNARGEAMIYAAAAALARDDDTRGRDGNEASEGLSRALEDPALVTAVADCQHYELAPWQDAATRINYRRFFDVSGLAALRIEDPAVFEATHRLVIELVRAGIVSGLRVDHPDGLRDPANYFRRLQQAVAEGGDGQHDKGSLYIVAEKILAEGEDLPEDWPVNGTTGYDFANLACGLLLDGETDDAVDRSWRDFTGETTARFADLAVAGKKEVIGSSFGSELKSLSRRFLDLLPQEQRDESNLPLIATVLAEAIACFPVYRTYPGPVASAEARRVVRIACGEAAHRLDAGPGRDGREPALLALLEQILTGPTGDFEAPEGARAPEDHARAQWAVRFQQLCAPVMAKGVEDTGLYRWTRLVSINDVGADPDVTGVTVEHFHEANARRRAAWPHAMLATSTHDNKRGEYVRMRINLISEDPEGWSRMARDWRAAADALMKRAGMRRQPAPADLYLLFQTFVGTWPVPAQDTYAQRLKAYMTKACREAKLHTSWTRPDEGYEGAVHQLIDLVLGDDELAARIGRDLRPYAWYGGLNSLSLTALKLTVPGVPDIYQGANVLDDSLVDPDNRRPVDFAAREALIHELAELADRPGPEIRQALAGWLAAGDFARLKLWTIHRLLGWRALHPQLFEAGGYVPVPVKGARARHCVAFARSNPRHGVLVLATRLYRELGYPCADQSGQEAGFSWDDTRLDLQAAGIRAVNPRDILLSPAGAAGEDDTPRMERVGATPALADLFAILPIAVISFDVAQG